MELDEFIRLCRLPEIHSGFEPRGSADLQGWNSTSCAFGHVIDLVRPRSIIEVGSWKGASAVYMGQLVRAQQLDCRILCIDTWLGGPGTYPSEELSDILPVGGRFRMLEQFLTNVHLSGLADMIYPMPSTSADAAGSLRELGVIVDLIYIDAGHEEHEARSDLEGYWSLVRPGGIVFGDDYVFDNWPGVVRAADDFAARLGLPIEECDHKFIIRKPADWKG